MQIGTDHLGHVLTERLLPMITRAEAKAEAEGKINDASSAAASFVAEAEAEAKINDASSSAASFGEIPASLSRGVISRFIGVISGVIGVIIIGVAGVIPGIV